MPGVLPNRKLYHRRQSIVPSVTAAPCPTSNTPVTGSKITLHRRAGRTETESYSFNNHFEVSLPPLKFGTSLVSRVAEKQTNSEFEQQRMSKAGKMVHSIPCDLNPPYIEPSERGVSSSRAGLPITPYIEPSERGVSSSRAGLTITSGKQDREQSRPQTAPVVRRSEDLLTARTGNACCLSSGQSSTLSEASIQITRESPSYRKKSGTRGLTRLSVCNMPRQQYVPSGREVIARARGEAVGDCMSEASRNSQNVREQVHQERGVQGKNKQGIVDGSRTKEDVGLLEVFPGAAQKAGQKVKAKSRPRTVLKASKRSSYISSKCEVEEIKNPGVKDMSYERIDTFNEIADDIDETTDRGKETQRAEVDGTCDDLPGTETNSEGAFDCVEETTCQVWENLGDMGRSNCDDETKTCSVKGTNLSVEAMTLSTDVERTTDRTCGVDRISGNEERATDRTCNVDRISGNEERTTDRTCNVDRISGNEERTSAKTYWDYLRQPKSCPTTSASQHSDHEDVRIDSFFTDSAESDHDVRNNLMCAEKIAALDVSNKSMSEHFDSDGRQSGKSPSGTSVESDGKEIIKVTCAKKQKVLKWIPSKQGLPEESQEGCLIYKVTEKAMAKKVSASKQQSKRPVTSRGQREREEVLSRLTSLPARKAQAQREQRKKLTDPIKKNTFFPAAVKLPFSGWSSSTNNRHFNNDLMDVCTNSVCKPNFVEGETSEGDISLKGKIKGDTLQSSDCDHHNSSMDNLPDVAKSKTLPCDCEADETPALLQEPCERSANPCKNREHNTTKPEDDYSARTCSPPSLYPCVFEQSRGVCQEIDEVLGVNTAVESTEFLEFSYFNDFLPSPDMTSEDYMPVWGLKQCPRELTGAFETFPGGENLGSLIPTERLDIHSPFLGRSSNKAAGGKPRISVVPAKVPIEFLNTANTGEHLDQIPKASRPSNEITRNRQSYARITLPREVQQKWTKTLELPPTFFSGHLTSLGLDMVQKSLTLIKRFTTGQKLENAFLQLQGQKVKYHPKEAQRSAGWMPQMFFTLDHESPTWPQQVLCQTCRRDCGLETSPSPEQTITDLTSGVRSPGSSISTCVHGLTGSCTECANVRGLLDDLLSEKERRDGHSLDISGWESVSSQT